MQLTVIHHFENYKPGDLITDAAAIAAILKSENAVKVVKVASTGDKK